jgi:glycosyltransferase involved in cell wall biosynthesis
MSTLFGMMRIKNETRWIEEVIWSILPICERVFILDDHSTDGTDTMCERQAENVTVYRSPFEGLDESRDKEFLLERIMNCVSDIWLTGGETSPYWVLAIDGDEVLTAAGRHAIRRTIAETRMHAFKLPITYLWNDREHRRVDGVYRHFARPSLFRLMNKAFRFQRTPWGGNFHCSSIPQELLHHAHGLCDAPLLHLGYMDKWDRLRKYKWYTSQDPNNPAEDNYRHIVQGDVPEVPAEARLMHAGPLEIVPC